MSALPSSLARTLTLVRSFAWNRFLAQFEHLEQTYFGQTEIDLGEKELDQVLGFDYDLDNFAAAVGFAKHVIVTASQDPGASILPSFPPLRPHARWLTLIALDLRFEQRSSSTLVRRVWTRLSTPLSSTSSISSRASSLLPSEWITCSEGDEEARADWSLFDQTGNSFDASRISFDRLQLFVRPFCPISSLSPTTFRTLWTSLSRSVSFHHCQRSI